MFASKKRSSNKRHGLMTVRSLVCMTDKELRKKKDILTKKIRELNRLESRKDCKNIIALLDGYFIPEIDKVIRIEQIFNRAFVDETTDIHIKEEIEELLVCFEDLKREILNVTDLSLFKNRVEILRRYLQKEQFETYEKEKNALIMVVGIQRNSIEYWKKKFMRIVFYPGLVFSFLSVLCLSYNDFSHNSKEVNDVEPMVLFDSLIRNYVLESNVYYYKSIKIHNRLERDSNNNVEIICEIASRYFNFENLANMGLQGIVFLNIQDFINDYDYEINMTLGLKDLLMNITGFYNSMTGRVFVGSLEGESYTLELDVIFHEMGHFIHFNLENKEEFDRDFIRIQPNILISESVSIMRSIRNQSGEREFSDETINKEMVTRLLSMILLTHYFIGIAQEEFTLDEFVGYFLNRWEEELSKDYKLEEHEIKLKELIHLYQKWGFIPKNLFNI